MIDKLIRFAKEHHESFRDFSDEKIRQFFEKYKETTIVRLTDDGEVTGFCIYAWKGDTAVFFTIAGIGDMLENYRTMRYYLKKYFKDVPVRILREGEVL